MVENCSSIILYLPFSVDTLSPKDMIKSNCFVLPINRCSHSFISLYCDCAVMGLVSLFYGEKSGVFFAAAGLRNSAHFYWVSGHDNLQNEPSELLVCQFGRLCVNCALCAGCCTGSRASLPQHDKLQNSVCFSRKQQSTIFWKKIVWFFVFFRLILTSFRILIIIAVKRKAKEDTAMARFKISDGETSDRKKTTLEVLL